MAQATKLQEEFKKLNLIPVRTDTYESSFTAGDIQVTVVWATRSTPKPKQG